VPLPGGVGVHRAAGLDDEPDPLLPQPAASRVGVTVGSDLGRAQESDEALSPHLVGQARTAAGVVRREALQMRRGGAVPADGGQRRPQHVLVIVEKRLAEPFDCDRREGVGRGGRGGQLRVHLGGDLPGRLLVVGDTAADLPRAVLVIDVPRAVAWIIRDATDAPARAPLPGTGHRKNPPVHRVCTNYAPARVFDGAKETLSHFT
jgi:hypothetical protein